MALAYRGIRECTSDYWLGKVLNAEIMLAQYEVHSRDCWLCTKSRTVHSPGSGFRFWAADGYPCCGNKN